MLRRLLPLAVVALVAAPVALADGGAATVAASPLLAPGGKTHYVALTSGRTTTLNLSRRNGVVIRWRDIRGRWNIPGVTLNGAPGGLSADGRTLVLVHLPTAPVPTRSVFQVVRTRDFAPLRRIVLKGSFSYDALSPDGSRLYLIQHVSQQNLSRYVVRAYALDQGRLLPGRIADRTQRGWVMAGYPVARVTSADGRWAYTFYVRGGGYPFVHALDTVRGVAHCIGIPWHGNQDPLLRMRLSLPDGGHTLRLILPRGREYLSVATGTWRISHPGAKAPPNADSGSGSGFPWWVLGVAGAGVLVLLGLRRVGYTLRARAATN